MRYLIGLLVLAAPLALATGCNSSSVAAQGEEAEGHGHDHDHDHGHRPASLHAGVAQLAEIRDELRAAMDADRPDDAHHPLHEVAALLDVLPEVAADTDLPKDKWDLVNSEVERLFDAFGTIDKAFHKKDGDKVGAYNEVADTIDEGIAAIEALLPLTGEDPTADHDHDGHDHDHEHDHDHDDHDDHDGHDHDHDA